MGGPPSRGQGFLEELSYFGFPGGDQRRHASLRLGAGVRSRSEQDVHARDRPVDAGEVKRSVEEPVPRVDVGPVLHQHGDYLVVRCGVKGKL